MEEFAVLLELLAVVRRQYHDGLVQEAPGLEPPKEVPSSRSRLLSPAS